MLATSVLPLLAVAAVVVIAVAIVLIRRLLRSVGASTVVNDSVESGTDVVRCGFKLLSPGKLSSSWGTCTARISDADLAVRTLLGDYTWQFRDAVVDRPRKRILGYRVRIADEHRTADILVRDPHALVEILTHHGWTD